MQLPIGFAKVWLGWRRCARHVLAPALLFSVTSMGAVTQPAFAAADDGDARLFFTDFVAAQNTHDVAAVRLLLWDSPDMLWFTRGVELRGQSAIADTLQSYYTGTWHLDPDMGRFRATAITPDVTQILVPITFTRGHPGQAAQSNTFLISQTLVHGPQGWRVATILPVANTQFK